MRLLKHLFPLLMLGAGNALAAGGGTAQGTLFAGQGLDWQRTGTEAQPFNEGVKVPNWPPAAGTYVVNAARITLGTACNPVSARVATCVADVTLKAVSTPSMLCGRWLSDKPMPQRLYALNGRVMKDGSFAWQPPGPPPPREVTFACAAANPAHITEEEWGGMGALGKCLDWPLGGGAFGFPPTSSSADEFEACIRMVRADYCGDGVSHTKDGTLIDPYRATAFPTHVPLPAFILEANWDPKGAVCIIHARYVSLPPACQAKFTSAIGVLAEPGFTDAGVTGMRGSDYWCRSVTLNQMCEPDCANECQGKQQTGKHRCPWFKQVRDALTTGGLLMDDSLIQP